MSKYVERFNVVERVLHWFMVVAFFLLVFTGLGLFAHTFYGYFNFFGGPHQAMLIHKWAGLMFFTSSLLLAFSHLKDLFTFDADDVLWIKKCGGYLSKGHEDIPQGKFNCGQKLFGIFSLAATFIMGITGFILWFAEGFARGAVQASLLLHSLFFVLFVLAAIVHIYLTTLGNPGTISSMLYGNVTKGWAKMHAIKWYRKVEKG
ncbi:formate dehydrogenase subunit gamma [Geoalkalibacter halelectricus]|uniref:Formate dehydrogenase subunit gamma n=1 Tax=Geoalkalibacter halelectricus TaxID=2847045 RepID=A0ABY5ZJH1_9BACT|nr:formate dehydrogenase subunit gamma [Geoalkalibacter halelectricus]MDO3377242.1 formate dehydrogenase subunit gamma [Geoalkalibacter halelectricus]UWZ78881.1 formate dehydrogenase subunit gamma [Geoalkalibacter halelectricus]